MGTKYTRGFTLIELLVVVAIIGILISVGAVSYMTAQKQSRDARRVSDMKEIQSAWEQYYSDNNSNYPGPVNPAATVACTMSLLSSPDTYFPGGFPEDPKTGVAYPAMQDGWSRCGSGSYCFCAGLEISPKLANYATDCSGAVTAGYTHGFYCVRNLQ